MVEIFKRQEKKRHADQNDVDVKEDETVTPRLTGGGLGPTNSSYEVNVYELAQTRK